MYQALVTGEEVGKTIINSNYNSKKINEILKTKNKHKKFIYILTRFGKLGNFAFYFLIELSKIPYFRKKLIDFCA